MEFMDMLYEILDLCIVPLLGILTTYLVKYINIKGQQLTTQVDNEMAAKYVVMLTTTITDCVIATNQTYVSSLKQQGKFNAEAQKKAFEMTYQAVMDILTVDAKEYLSSVYGDLDLYLTKRIEAEVMQNK